MSILPAAAPQEGLTVSVIAMARRLHLYAAETAIGTSLDIGDTAQSLAQSLLAWGDVAAVDLDFAVWTGEGVTGQGQGRIRLRRAALVPDRAWPEGYVTPGDDLPSDASRLLAQAVWRDDAPQAIVIPDREAVERVLGGPRVMRALVPGDRSAGVACIPLVLDRAPPVVLGVAEVWRRADCPFRDSELFDLQELVARTAHHVDLARQHQREHTQVLALQRRLLPRTGGDTIDIASIYRPATPDSAGVGGDWVNSFPLPDGRTALVVGDVVGHGLGAAATMGQLSMEARALLSAGLAPDEVLEHLDETVTLMDEAESGLAAGYSALGSTCCIALYDPVSHHMALSSAGHLPRSWSPRTGTRARSRSALTPAWAPSSRCGSRSRCTRSAHPRAPCSPCTPTAWWRIRPCRSTRASAGWRTPCPGCTPGTLCSRPHGTSSPRWHPCASATM